METNENQNTTIQNLWDAAKAVLWGKYIAILASIQTLERTQIRKLTLHLKELEKKQQIDPTPSRRRELIKIRAELNEIETRRTVEQINRTRSWFFETIKKTDKPIASLIKKKREKTQINKIMNEKGEITTNTKEIQTILKTYHEQLYANKFLLNGRISRSSIVEGKSSLFLFGGGAWGGVGVETNPLPPLPPRRGRITS